MSWDVFFASGKDKITQKIKIKKKNIKSLCKSLRWPLADLTERSAWH